MGGSNQIRCPQVINCIILRISYVYGTYILRIWYVIEKGLTRKSKGLVLTNDTTSNCHTLLDTWCAFVGDMARTRSLRP